MRVFVIITCILYNLILQNYKTKTFFVFIDSVFWDILTNFWFHVYSIVINWASKTWQILINRENNCLLRNNVYLGKSLITLIIRLINIQVKRQRRNTRDKTQRTEELQHLRLLIIRLLLIRSGRLRASIEVTITTIIAAIYRDRKYSSGWPIANTDFKQLDLTAIFMIRSRR